MKQESGIVKNQRGETVSSNTFFKNTIQIVCSGLFKWFWWRGKGVGEMDASCESTSWQIQKNRFSTLISILTRQPPPLTESGTSLWKVFSPHRAKRTSVLYEHMPSACICPRCHSILGICSCIWPCNSKIFSNSCNRFQCTQDETSHKYAKYPWTSPNSKGGAQSLN